MKTKIILLTLFISCNVFAQQGINYKALIKDDLGNVLANTFMNVQFTIHESTETGTIVYQEDHNYTTDANGILVLVIGTDTTPSVGVFETIDWSSNQHFLQPTIAYSGGTINFDATEFMTVPYAKHSETAENITGVRSIYYESANGPQTGLDSGQIVSRVLSINKKEDLSVIRISYTDNLRTRVTNFANSCRWEIKVDGNSSPVQPLIYDIYNGSADDNPHRSRTFVGYFKGLSAGVHEIQIWVSSTPGYSNSDCFTGWNNNTWVIEAEEVYGND